MGEGLPPNHEMNPMRAMKLVPIRPPPQMSEPNRWSANLHDFISKCLTKDPAMRPTSVELLVVRILPLLS